MFSKLKSYKIKVSCQDLRQRYKEDIFSRLAIITVLYIS
jgi:hypothetical protein